MPSKFPSKSAQPKTPRRQLVRTVPESPEVEIHHDFEDAIEESEREFGVQTDSGPCWCNCHRTSVDAECQVKLPDINIDLDIKGNDENTRFYTGLYNWATFEAFSSTLLKHGSSRNGGNVLNYWGAGSLKNKRYHDGQEKPGPRRLFPMLLELFITLVWYKQAFIEEHLSFMFKTSVSTISRILITWTQFIYQHSCTLLYLPSREDILLNMPMHFINHCNTFRVDDCTEIYIEKPSGLEAQNVTWSEYKHNNTVKVLIGVSPDGMVTYISRVWGGRASDRHICEKDKALKNIPSGMAVMADKGFEVHDLLEDGTELITPPKVSSKGQMSDTEFFATVDVAEPRIVVEMKMEQAKNFKILQGPIPISRIATVEQIIYNCFALTNLLPPLLLPANNPDEAVPLPIYQ